MIIFLGNKGSTLNNVKVFQNIKNELLLQWNFVLIHILKLTNRLIVFETIRQLLWCDFHSKPDIQCLSLCQITVQGFSIVFL